jgi:hypothetical protein
MAKVSLHEQKQQLLTERENYKQHLLGEVKDLKDNALAAKEVLLEQAVDFKNDLIQTKNRVLLVASGLIIGYVAYRAVKGLLDIFVKDETPTVVASPPPAYAIYNPETEKKATFLSAIIDEIKREMLAFLLALAKKKLQEFLEEMYVQQMQKNQPQQP